MGDRWRPARMRSTARVLAAALALLATFVPIRQVAACDCAVSPLPQAIAEAEVAIIGRLAGMGASEAQPGMRAVEPVRYTWAVERSRDPINGDVVKQEDVKREAMKVDITALLGGDLYGNLRTRHQEARKRFSTERDESKALLERKRCLKELGKALDIPDEVLMSLPSVEDIQQRADRAKAKMAERQARSQTVKDVKPPPSEKEWGI